MTHYFVCYLCIIYKVNQKIVFAVKYKENIYTKITKPYSKYLKLVLLNGSLFRNGIGF